MTLKLILTRHAKSEWGDPLLDDFDRPLNARGRASAKAIAEWLADKGHVPEHVVVSGAKRTVETWAEMAPTLPQTPPAEVNTSLYHAGAATILKVLHAQTAPVIMLVGHNPGIGDFASRIVAARPSHPRYADYPTCATAVIEFDADSWPSVAPGAGRVLDFTVPRDLI